MSDNQDELVEDVIAIVKKFTRNNNVISSSSMANLNQWDSLAYMAITSEIELTYGVLITQDNIQKFDSIQSIIQLIKNK